MKIFICECLKKSKFEFISENNTEKKVLERNNRDADSAFTYLLSDQKA